jgi:hypothetical protein
MRSSHGIRRKEAVRRGLEFICRQARDPDNFNSYGFDYLFSFLISSNSRDAVVRRRSQQIGQDLSLLWVSEHQTLPLDLDADTITELVFGSYSADQFGVSHVQLQSHIRKAAGHFSAQEYFGFDPTVEPPPKDVPEECDCGADNYRGDRICRKCRGHLDVMSAYEVWVVALTRSYLGERYGVKLGVPYADVIKWLPHMRPYPECRKASDSDFIWSIYAITHVIYTSNDYNCKQLDPQWLPFEFSALKDSLREVIAREDPETVGEILDCLKSFGLVGKNPLVQEGVDYLLSRQNPDGSWSEPEIEDVYDRYHTTLAAINGLDEYVWQGKKLSFPELAPLLAEWAASP